jgi:hypothetical protein
MRADYDSQAGALDIEIFPFRHFERQEVVDDSFCMVGFAKGRPAAVELLDPATHLELLDVAASRFGLDAGALQAAARAALAAPDRVVELEVAAVSVSAA